MSAKRQKSVASKAKKAASPKVARLKLPRSRFFNIKTALIFVLVIAIVGTVNWKLTHALTSTDVSAEIEMGTPESNAAIIADAAASQAKATVFGSGGTVTDAPSRQLLIKHGWDVPNSSFFSQHITDMEKLPYDGVVVGHTNSATIQTATPVSYTTLKNDFSPFASTPKKTLKYNFIIVHMVIGDVWGDYSVQIQNFKNLAKAAREAGFYGIAYDNEEYFGHKSNYPEDCPGHTQPECEAQYALRGKQLMQGVIENWPDVRLFYFHGAYVSDSAMMDGMYNDCGYQLNNVAWANELKAPMTNGMAEAAIGTRAKMIDGGELYAERSQAEFACTYKWQKTNVPEQGSQISAILRPQWPNKVLSGHGVYDTPWQGLDMNPTIWKATVTNALKASDGIAWAYTEANDWWNVGWPSTHVTQDWIDATAQAKTAGVCPSLPTTYGMTTLTVKVPAGGNYRVWSRLKAPDSTNNSVYIEVDSSTCGMVLGDSATQPVNSWTWSDYKNGDSANKAAVNLTAGTHTIRIIGREPGVVFDRLILTTDGNCVPNGTGDACAPPLLPPSAQTVTLNAAATSYKVGDSVSVSWQIASGTATKARDWVGLYKAGAPDDQYIANAWVYTDAALSGTFSTVVSEAGQYEWRYLQDDGLVSVAKSPTITVSAILPTEPANGLKGSYFNGKNFDTAVLARTDATVNFNWGAGSPAAGVNANKFSVRWTGKVSPPASGTYRFYTQSDDGMRLWVNGKQLVNDWTTHLLSEKSGTINLKAGQKYDIKLEYFDATGEASAKLLWSGPDGIKTAIPSSRLFPQ